MEWVEARVVSSDYLRFGAKIPSSSPRSCMLSIHFSGSNSIDMIYYSISFVQNEHLLSN